MTSDTKLRIVTTLVIVSLATTVGIMLLRTPREVRGSFQEVSPGMILPPPSGYKWSKSQPTLVLALRIGCPHCENEMWFYDKLLALDRSQKPNVQLLAVLPDSEAKVKLAFGTRLVGLTKLADVQLGPLHVPGTPTLILLDSRGFVQKRWIGELSPDEEEEVLAAIRAQTH